MTVTHITPAYRAKLVRIARRFNPTLAEDMVQETLIKLAADPIERETPEKWTVHLLKCTASNLLKAERNKAAKFTRQLKPTDDATNELPSVERRMMARERLKAILATASPIQRTILAHLADGQDCPTIADLTGLSPASVRKIISRWRAQTAR